MSDKLTEEELYHNLDRVKRHLPFQVYDQLREIVRFYFSISDKPKEGYMKISDHPDIPFMKEIQQKPRVTREWIKKWADFWNDDFFSHKTSEHVEPHIEAMLEELGIEVVE